MQVNRRAGSLHFAPRVAATTVMAASILVMPPPAPLVGASVGPLSAGSLPWVIAAAPVAPSAALIVPHQTDGQTRPVAERGAQASGTTSARCRAGAMCAPWSVEPDREVVAHLVCADEEPRGAPREHFECDRAQLDERRKRWSPRSEGGGEAAHGDLAAVRREATPSIGLVCVRIVRKVAPPSSLAMSL